MDEHPDRRFDFGLIDDQMSDIDGIELARRLKEYPSLQATRLIMLTINDNHDNRSQDLQAFSAILTKPLRRAQLLHCMSKALSTSEADETGVHAVSELPAAIRQPKVLVVEDNAVNLEVAVGMLESLGCGAERVENGWLAIEALNDGGYDAVLMDCHMPVMDGLTATAEIRRREQAAGGARIPIIALTANAMEGDRERCLAAGMDDFLSKPFTRQKLSSVLSRWLAVKLQVQAERPEPSRPPLIDVGVLRNIVALQRPALLNSMIDLYLAHTPQLILAIESACAKGQSVQLFEALHTFKSSTSNLGGARLAALTRECEVAVRADNFAAAAPLVQRIRKDYQEFCTALGRERSPSAA
jgi:CheY-like chemotaxis protein